MKPGRRRLATLLRMAAALVASLPTVAHADFIPGRLYVTHAGDRKNPISPSDQILEVDPATGSYSVFYQFAAKEGLNSPVFTPGGDLRVARFRQSEVLQFDNGAAQPAVALTNADGVHFPGDLDYDRFGDLHSFNYFSRDIMRYPGGSGPGQVVSTMPGDPGHIAFGASGNLYWAGQALGANPGYQVRRVLPDGSSVLFDVFPPGQYPESIVGDALGNLFVGTANGAIYRYANEIAAQRVLLAGNVGAGNLTLSPDGALLYSSAGVRLYSTNATSGAVQVLLDLPQFRSITGIALIPEPGGISAILALPLFWRRTTRRIRKRQLEDQPCRESL